jgi:hypothetical protein
MICTRCSPLQVAQDAIFDARSICMREYATAPEVTVYGDPSFTFAYVPSHLHHMTFELVRGGRPGPGRMGLAAHTAPFAAPPWCPLEPGPVYGHRLVDVSLMASLRKPSAGRPSLLFTCLADQGRNEDAPRRPACFRLWPAISMLADRRSAAVA